MNSSPPVEIIIGIVARLGTKIDLLTKHIKTKAKELNYKVEEIRISSLMSDANYIGKKLINDKSIKQYITNIKSNDKDIRSKMDLGNTIRKKTNNNAYMSLLAVKKIIESRNKNNQKTIYIIRQLKRKEEIELLNEIYGHSFIQLSAYSSDKSVKDELSKHYNEDEIEEIINRDHCENKSYGQDIENCFSKAHYFISEDVSKPLLDQVERFLKILSCHPFIQPTYDEYFMAHANLASLRSMDLTRQVGAAIVDKNNRLISIGYNEVQGLRGPLSQENDDNKYFEYNKEYEFNSFKRDQITKDIINKIKEKKIVSCHCLAQELYPVIHKGIEPIEYMRATHAEMAAIIDAAKRGYKICNATMYVNTHPCHLCMKHIIAAGINNVIYITPYPKNKVFEMFNDFITYDEPSKNKLTISPFVGVSPLRYFYVFDIRFKSRKKTGANKNYKINMPNHEYEYFPNYIKYNNPITYQTKETAIQKSLSKINENNTDQSSNDPSIEWALNLLLSFKPKVQ